ncbi:right-handed parallel beta-helix repeat-containing protein [Ferrimonas pelagia]|uniref:Right handed beta helix domain-containing protein n=1 Tax=Ferrimonas pelagia TaxID=1177826 RepID=A0ABP9FIZ0_9GAMM
MFPPRTLLALCMGLCALPAYSAELYLDPYGSDHATGDAQTPLASLPEAQRRVRALLNAGETEITVHLAEGRYALNEPLHFGPEDAGSAEQIVTYQGPQQGIAELSGGWSVQGWHPVANSPLWQMTLPEAIGPAAHEQLHALWINDQRQILARWPNADAERPIYDVLDSKVARDWSHYEITLENGDGLKDLDDLSGVRLRGYKVWASTHKEIESFEPDANRLVLKPPHAPAPSFNRLRTHSAYFVENHPSFLDQPGEWFYDQAQRTIQYWPQPGMDLSQSETVIPRLRHLINIKGNAERPVQNLHFRNLRFAHTDYQYPAHGFEGGQSAVAYMPNGTPPQGLLREVQDNAVSVEYATQISFEASEFKMLATNGLYIGEGAHHSQVEGNEFTDIGGNNIEVGLMSSSPEQPSHIRIANNYIHDSTTTFWSGIGISGKFANDIDIEHNTLRNLAYNGISIGWRWDDTPTSIERYRVNHNHISHMVQQVNDGGGLYTLGYQPGTLIFNNVIHDIHLGITHHGVANRGVFFDEGSKGYYVKDNILFDTLNDYVYNQSRQDYMIWGDGNLAGLTKDELTGHEPALKTAGLEPQWAERLLPAELQRDKVLPQPRADITLYSDEEALAIHKRLPQLCEMDSYETPDTILAKLELDPIRLKFAGDQGLANTLQLGRRLVSHWQLSENYDIWFIQRLNDDGEFQLRRCNVLMQQRPWPHEPPMHRRIK